ncbi:TBC1 domain family member 7 isoform X1 [Monomorium pharaonis]|uniref:TBC1 domain family member 7 isoform X1 n=1 Tax=Monomorium pharaonis TaxID=307658 RepID=UPI00063EDA46|nr:TBC1 domain family member 7 isoform X1 [Monomorium pharaonis]
MTTDERNFRSQYYEKVGFRSVEEKKSLEILLKERPLDKTKLKQFCLRFTVPAMYRNFLWKVLLDVVPVYTESQAFIMAQRKAEFQDLQRALRVAKIIDDFTKPHLMFLVMWLLRKRKAKVDMTTQLESPLYRAMSKMAETLWHIIDVELEEEKLVDVYWILSGLFVQVEKLQKEIGKLQDCTYMLLEKEDLELYKHLIKIDALYNLPYDAWFYSCFAGIICNGSIAKIWDKITVGAYRILIFVAVVTLTTLRRLLLRCESTETVLDTINNITEETSEVIVNKAIESMQQSGTTQQVDMYFTKHS